MKNVKFLVLGLAALSIALVGCKDDEPVQPVSGYMEDGFYVVGEATAIVELSADGADRALMAVGIDENDGQKERAGMYEKYVALEGGKPFSLVQKAGVTETQYGATLTLSDTLSGDNEPAIQIYKGALTESGSLQVAESGLYHIVLDVNLKAIIIAPVEWGVRGVNGNWGFTAIPKPTFSKTSMKYTLTNAENATDGEFKFAYGGGWKIELNPDGTPLVKANTNLGNNGGKDGDPLTAQLAPGGPNIGLGRGIYTIELEWKLAKGAIKEGYTAMITKTGEAAVVNYTDCEVELVGGGIDSINGGPKDVAWGGWGFTLSAGKPAVSGAAYTWTWDSVILKAEGFKIRSLNGAASGGASVDVGFGAVDTAASPNVVDDDGNLKVTEAGSYKIVLTIDAAANTRRVVVTKL